MPISAVDKGFTPRPMNRRYAEAGTAGRCSPGLGIGAEMPT